MIDKIKDLLGSIRFWQITAAAFFQAVKIYAPDLQPLWDILSAWFVAVAGVGTVDRLRK